MKIIIYDAEVFRFDSMFGFLTINENGSKEIYQTWNKEDVKNFYLDNVSDSIFVGHNCLTYDNPILEQMNRGKNPYDTSKKIVRDNIRARCYLDIMSFDNMRIRRQPFSLKLTELIAGKKIDQSDVDFDLPRPLTLEEKIRTESYNLSDLEQTLYNFERFYPQFELRLMIAKTFGLPVKDALKLTEAQLAARVLGAKKDDSLRYKPVKPKIWDTLHIKNEKVREWYLNEKYMTSNLSVRLCECDLTLGKGGIHGAELKCHYDKLLYADVGGFYNRIMLNLDLFPRTMSEESKQKYRSMFKDQLEMKKDPSKANARKAFKTILLSVFGAMNNEYGDFYDPAHFYLVTLSGQLYIIDLLEKLDGLVKGVNINTDGIMIAVKDPKDEDKAKVIIREWEDRTDFEMEVGYLYDMWQRDVNTYFCLDEKGNVDYKGSDVVNYMTDDKAFGAGKLFDANNPPVIAKGLIDWLLFDVPVEETVQKCKTDLRNFQYACKKGTFDFMTYDTIRLVKKPGRKAAIEEKVSSETMKPLVRAFAARIQYDPDGNAVIHTLVKHKDPSKKGASTQKVGNLPESVFLWNDSIENPPQELKDRIDYQFYIDKIYDKVLEFIQ